MTHTTRALRLPWIHGVRVPSSSPNVIIIIIIITPTTTTVLLSPPMLQRTRGREAEGREVRLPCRAPYPRRNRRTALGTIGALLACVNSTDRGAPLSNRPYMVTRRLLRSCYRQEAQEKCSLSSPNPLRKHQQEEEQHQHQQEEEEEEGHRRWRRGGGEEGEEKDWGEEEEEEEEVQQQRGWRSQARGQT